MTQSVHLGFPTALTGLDAENFEQMQRDPSMREIMLCGSRQREPRA